MFEAIVRPFAAPASVATTRLVASRTQVPPQTARLIWGAAGTLPIAIAELVPTLVAPTPPVNCDAQLSERPGTRVTQDVRVENPSDPSQYMINRRIVKIGFSRKAAVSEINLKFTLNPKTGLVTVSPIQPPCKEDVGFLPQFNI